MNALLHRKQFLEYRCDVVPSVAADHQPSSSILHSLQLVDQAIRDRDRDRDATYETVRIVNSRYDE